MSGGSNRRRYDRLPISLDVTLLQGGGPPLAKITNIGPEGAFLSLPGPYQMDQRLKLRFALAEGVEPIETDAVVRWARGADPVGIGVQFVALAEEARQAIYYFCIRKIAEMRGLI